MVVGRMMVQVQGNRASRVTISVSRLDSPYKVNGLKSRSSLGWWPASQTNCVLVTMMRSTVGQAFTAVNRRRVPSWFCA